MTPSEQNRYILKNSEFKKELPGDPGVYLFRDSAERVIYVGKAKNLKNRVSSYFNSQSEMTPKTIMMVSKARLQDKTTLTGGRDYYFPPKIRFLLIFTDSHYLEISRWSVIAP